MLRCIDEGRWGKGSGFEEFTNDKVDMTTMSEKKFLRESDKSYEEAGLS
jgi:hypothetical protein